MNFLEYVSQDKEANRGNTTKGKYVVPLFRLAQFVQRRRALSILLFWYFPLYKFFTHWLLCVEIYPESEIGSGLQLWHAHALVVHPNTKIGLNCTLRQSTTIGIKMGKDGSTNHHAPIIGNNVDIGANSVIIGPISIGNNAIIGAGSIVVKDVPANAVVVGNPARIVGRNAAVESVSEVFTAINTQAIVNTQVAL
jgi:serine acetyltransferase